MASRWAILLLLALAVSAQNAGDTNNNNDNGGNNQPAASSSAADQNSQPSSTQAQTTKADSSGNKGSATHTAKQTDTKQDSSSAAASSAASSAAASSISIGAAPTITDASLSQFSLTATFPTIFGVGPVTQMVPDTHAAPFRQKSDLPEGTVFIAVGAILGFLGMSILAWRGAVAWSLHRSVQRAARNNPMGDLKKPGGNTRSMYSAQATSTVSLDRLSAVPGKANRLSRGPHASTMPIGANPTAARNSSLFFSPTAGAGNHSNPSLLGVGPQNRSSAFLPAGYYSSPSASSPAPGATSAHVGAPSAFSHLNPLNAAARAGYQPARNLGPSPPGSPSLPPARRSGEDLRRYGDANTPSSLATAGVRSTNTTPLYAHSSNSNLMLNVPGGAANGQRAPSANLEDLFEHHGNGMNRY